MHFTISCGGMGEDAISKDHEYADFVRRDGEELRHMSKTAGRG